MRNLLLAALLLVPVSASCVAVAAVGAGVLVGQQIVEDNVYVGQLSTETKMTWAQCKTTLSHMSTKPIDVSEEMRKAVAEIDGAAVTVTVETYDLNRSELRVSAKKYGFAASETARLVFERITQDLDKAVGKTAAK